MMISLQVAQKPFVPNPPDFTPHFFDPEIVSLSKIGKPISKQEAIVPSKSIETIQPSSEKKLVSKTDPHFIEPNLSTATLMKYQKFLNQCVEHKYETSDFGTICRNHPEAKCPYPGPMPENPNKSKTVLTQFVRRGISKKFRNQEREYKDALRHWEAQMKNHILEVPFLRAKDAMFKGYVALMENNPEDAFTWAQEALEDHAFNTDALAIQIIALHQKGDLEACLALEAKLSKIQPSLPLNSLGHSLLENIIQVALSEIYKETCERALSELKVLETKIPLDQSFFQNMVLSHLSKTCQDHFKREQVDFLDLISLYFVEKIVSESPGQQAKEICNHIQMDFPHLAAMFEAVQENINLIASLEMWSAFDSLQALQENASPDIVKDKNWIKQLIEELSQPISFGDESFKRAFMLNALKIQTEKALFELGPLLENSLEVV